MSGRSGERGQASPEWIGLVLLVALALAGLVALGVRVPGTDLARAIAARLVCAAGLGSGCGEEGELALAYGPELAAMVAEQTPAIGYEDGMRALPVDFRACRLDRCAEGPGAGSVARSLRGQPATAFVHVVDCRAPETAEDYDCSDDRAGNVYLQYWLYYPGSQTSRALLGDAGFHEDDWESFQVRVGSEHLDARASSHHGYNYRGGPLNWAVDAGLVSRAGWGEDRGTYFVSGGSHAGHVYEHADPREGRWTPSAELRLIPLEPLGGELESYEFAVTPPWRKRVYRDPEYEGTD